MNKILIDFFEFCVLIESSWHSGTILRHSIMQKAINIWYRQLDDDERARAFDFFNRTKGDEVTLNIQKIFMARYDPKNQYDVHTLYKGKEDIVRAFLFNDKYYTGETTFIAPEYITKVVKMSL